MCSSAGADGVPTKIDALLAAVAGPLRKRFPVRLAVEPTRPTRIALARVADDRGDHESLTITWLLRDLGADGTEVTIELGARLDVPMFLRSTRSRVRSRTGFCRPRWRRSKSRGGRKCVPTTHFPVSGRSR